MGNLMFPAELCVPLHPYLHTQGQGQRKVQY